MESEIEEYPSNKVANYISKKISIKTRKSIYLWIGVILISQFMTIIWFEIDKTHGSMRNIIGLILPMIAGITFAYFIYKNTTKKIRFVTTVITSLLAFTIVMYSDIFQNSEIFYEIFIDLLLIEIFIYCKKLHIEGIEYKNIPIKYIYI
jgi:hypothetical protein